MSKRTLLVVDDVEMNRGILCATFEGEYDIMQAADGREALDIMEANLDKLSAVLLDVIMPVMDGIAVVEEMNTRGWIEKLPVFLVTADTSHEMMKKGYDLGVVDIILKPITPLFVSRRIGNVIKLNDIVNRQEDLLSQQAMEIRELNRSILETLSTAIEFRDCESGEHVIRMSSLTLFLLQAVNKYYPEHGVEKTKLQDIADAAVMHDVGKIAIPDSILNKPGRLTEQEFEIMKTHTIRGCELLKSVPKMKENPVYEYAYDICRHHHERWDGRGYPDGLRGDEISICAQVVSLADVYDALVSERVYKSAYTHEEAIRMILDGECGQFNPILMECLKKVEKEIRMSYTQKL